MSYITWWIQKIKSRFNNEFTGSEEGRDSNTDYNHCPMLYVKVNLTNSPKHMFRVEIRSSNRITRIYIASWISNGVAIDID